MRAELARRVPEVQVLDGTAERIPLGDGSVDAVTVASAFHWFDAERALAEVHRVLRRGDGLALVWNARDERDAVQAELSEIIGPLREPGTPDRRARDWKTLLADSGLFDRTERLLFSHVQPVDEQGVVDRVLSISFIAASSADVRADVERRVRDIAVGATQLSYMTELYLGFAV
jgi:SAM-dependent methyltransferase